MYENYKEIMKHLHKYRIRLYPSGSQGICLEKTIALSGGIRAAKDYALSLKSEFDNVELIALEDVAMGIHYTYLDNTWEKV